MNTVIREEDSEEEYIETNSPCTPIRYEEYTEMTVPYPSEINEEEYIEMVELEPSVNSIYPNGYVNDLLFTEIYIDTKPVKALIDTGSQASLMIKELADDLNLHIQEYKGPQLNSASKDKIKVLGAVNVDLKLKDKTEIKSLAIVNELPSNIKYLIGRNCLTKDQL